MARKEASISLSLLPKVTAFTVPSSFSSTVTGKLPVRPLAVTVFPSAAGAAAGSAVAKLFTASITALLLMVAPEAISASTGRALPANWARKASSSLFRNS